MSDDTVGRLAAGAMEAGSLAAAFVGGVALGIAAEHPQDMSNAAAAARMTLLENVNDIVSARDDTLRLPLPITAGGLVVPARPQYAPLDRLQSCRKRHHYRWQVEMDS